MKQILGSKLRSWIVAVFAGAIWILSASNARAAGTIIYDQTDLVSDLPGAVQPADPNLLNAWGIAFLPTSPFWVNANGNGTSNLYDGAGVIFSGLPESSFRHRHQLLPIQQHRRGSLRILTMCS